MANADDLYGRDAIAALAGELRRIEQRTPAADEVPAGEHVIVGYRLADTVLTDAPLTRGVCETGGEGTLLKIVEQSVRRVDGAFEGSPIAGPGHGRGPPADRGRGGER